MLAVLGVKVLLNPFVIPYSATWFMMRVITWSSTQDNASSHKTMPDNNKGRREEHATSNLDPQAGYLPDTSSGDPEFDAMFAEELIEVYVKRGTGDFETAEQLEASIDREATHHILLASVSAEPKFSATGYSSRGPIETANGAKAVEPAPGSGRDPTDRAWMTLRTE
ncbi:hypothetical protein SNOG_05480 [Parastagonospora nodorum SN15]|uniref:Uncharacterized protein n=1 Tax=Phaeosphaeria nodorum (strain SN15 / ATCC MYA-4574 / FGSC 10173) TaxID=321614 RepID=Q0URY4_PHANO|nr:hypothetical protein SNOG_05480 [Parastagonospora nodorum SN15]EAT86544.1 hypothetical protein SNOG_05480 [Parastagonospora nodorum SN15]